MLEISKIIERAELAAQDADAVKNTISMLRTKDLKAILTALHNSMRRTRVAEEKVRLMTRDCDGKQTAQQAGDK
jgi:hypothetical protein